MSRRRRRQAVVRNGRQWQLAKQLGSEVFKKPLRLGFCYKFRAKIWASNQIASNRKISQPNEGKGSLGTSYYCLSLHTLSENVLPFLFEIIYDSQKSCVFCSVSVLPRRWKCKRNFFKFLSNHTCVFLCWIPSIQTLSGFEQNEYYWFTWWNWS